MMIVTGRYPSPSRGGSEVIPYSYLEITHHPQVSFMWNTPIFGMQLMWEDPTTTLLKLARLQDDQALHIGNMRFKGVVDEPEMIGLSMEGLPHDVWFMREELKLAVAFMRFVGIVTAYYGEDVSGWFGVFAPPVFADPEIFTVGFKLPRYLKEEGDRPPKSYTIQRTVSAAVDNALRYAFGVGTDHHVAVDVAIGRVETDDPEYGPCYMVGAVIALPMSGKPWFTKK